MPAPFFASLSGIPIVAMTLVIPYSGIWHADIRLDRAIGPTAGPQLLSLSDLTGACAVVRSVDFAGSRGLRVVGGTGGWRTVVPPLQYQSPTGVPVALVAGDAAALVQELPPVIGPTVSPTAGPTFVRQGGLASLVLQSLFADGWWMNMLGVVQVTPRLPTPIVAPFDWLDSRGAQGLYRIASQGDILTPWVPGAKFLGPTMTAPATVNRVTHVVEGARVRTEVSTWP
jgi:hypothetical protein